MVAPQGCLLKMCMMLMLPPSGQRGQLVAATVSELGFTPVVIEVTATVFYLRLKS